MRLRTEENDLTGAWLVEGGQVIADEVCQRIEILVEGRLQLIDSADGGWSRLYLDPEDGRYWELTYPQSAMHGGGPTRLAHISADAAKIKYGVD
jgi:Immunity protein 27